MAGLSFPGQPIFFITALQEPVYGRNQPHDLLFAHLHAPPDRAERTGIQPGSIHHLLPAHDQARALRAAHPLSAAENHQIGAHTRDLCQVRSGWQLRCSVHDHGNPTLACPGDHLPELFLALLPQEMDHGRCPVPDPTQQILRGHLSLAAHPDQMSAADFHPLMDVRVSIHQTDHEFVLPSLRSG